MPARVRTLHPPAKSSLRKTLGQRAQVVALAHVDAVVAEDRVRVREVEEEVRNGVLEEVVRSGHHLALPAGLRDDARRCALEVLGREPVEVRDDRSHARVEVLDRLLVVGMHGRVFAGEARRGELHGVTGRLHVARERELIRREPEPQEEVGVERFLLGEGGPRVQPLVELAEHLLHLENGFEIHGRDGTRIREVGQGRPGPASSGGCGEVLRWATMALDDLLGRVLGHVSRLTIRRLGPPGAFLVEDGSGPSVATATDAQDANPSAPTVLLPRAEVPEGAKAGDELEVFVYLDSDDRPVATRGAPRLELGEVTFLTVSDVGRFGAFVDWGLPKELLVPFAEQTRDVNVGERHPIGLYVDKTGRLA